MITSKAKTGCVIFVLTSFRNSLLLELLYYNSLKVHYFMADKLQNYIGFTYL